MRNQCSRVKAFRQLSQTNRRNSLTRPLGPLDVRWRWLRRLVRRMFSKNLASSPNRLAQLLVYVTMWHITSTWHRTLKKYGQKSNCALLNYGNIVCEEDLKKRENLTWNIATTSNALCRRFLASSRTYEAAEFQSNHRPTRTKQMWARAVLWSEAVRRG